MISSSLFFVTISCLAVAYANPFNKYLLNMMTQGMDPMTKSIMQSTIGADLLDMDMGSSQSSNGYGSFSPMRYGLNNYYGSPMSNNYPWLFSPPSSPSFPTTNLVQPSAIKPSNPYASPSSGNRQLITSKSATIGGTSGASTGSGATVGSGAYSGGTSTGGRGGSPFMPSFYPMGYSLWRNLLMMNMMGFDMF